MTTSTSPTVLRVDPERPGLPGLLQVACLAGAGLGVLDLVLQLSLPYPWANLANSSAVWALAAFALAYWARTTLGNAALAGTVMLVVAVEVYYVAAIVLDRAGPASLVAPTTLMWLLFGVLAGSVFGIAGTWARQERPWRAATGLAAAAAVLFSEAIVRLLPGSGSAMGDLGTTLLTLGLGVAVLLAAATRPAHLARTLIVVPALVVLGTAALAVAGW